METVALLSRSEQQSAKSITQGRRVQGTKAEMYVADVEVERADILN